METSRVEALLAIAVENALEVLRREPCPSEVGPESDNHKQSVIRYFIDELYANTKTGDKN